MHRRAGLGAGLALVGGVAGAQPEDTDFASVVYVDAGAAPGGDGQTWATAYRFLQDALADTGDPPREIRVAQGTYEPDRSSDAPGGTGERTASFFMTDQTAIVGGYAGVAGADPDARDPARFLTVLSGDLARDDAWPDPDTTDDNAYHVVQCWHASSTAVLDGAVVSAGRANRPIAQWDHNTTRDDSGAGVLMVESDAIVRACTFRHNRADANASVWIALSGTFAYVEAGSGAVMIVGGAPRLADCHFEDNRANRLGGALGVYWSPAIVERCSFVANECGTADFGDISFGAALADVTNAFPLGRARYEACTFINNAMTNAIDTTFSIFSASDFVNCLWLANGGTGLKIDNGVLVRLINCAVVGNGALGVFECADTFNPVELHNSIAWGNAGRFAGENPNLYSFNAGLALYDTIVGEADVFPVRAHAGVNVHVFDPRFADVLGPDGIMWTGDENLRPRPGSPANDRGDNARLALPAMGPVLVDLDGRPRRAEDRLGPNLGTGFSPIVDLGPYERTGPGGWTVPIAERAR